MIRLGELLVAAGLLTTEQVERALRAQVMWGARLGTNLVELALIDLDSVTVHLGRQHNLPAALSRHFDRVDPGLQKLLAPEIAETFCCLPLMRAGPQRDIVIAAASPLSKKALARIADELAVKPTQLIISIAAELRVRYQLERVYGIRRPARFMRTPGSQDFPQFQTLEFEDSVVENVLQTDAPRPIEVEDERTTPLVAAAMQPAPEPEPVEEFELELESDDAVTRPVLSAPDDELAIETAFAEQPSGSFPSLAALDDLPADIAAKPAVPRALENETSSGIERRKYVRTIADGAAEAEAEDTSQVARIAIRRVAVTPPTGIVEPTGPGNTLGEATRAIRRATDRDRVAELSMHALFRFAPSCHASTLMVLRGTVATSWKGFCRSGAPHPELAVPLDQPGLIPRAAKSNQTVRAPSSDLSPMDQLLLVSLGHKVGELVVVPISISNEVMCVIAMVTEAEATTATPESIAAAAGGAFARLMRHASR